MDTLEQYRKDMEELGRALAQMALGALKASEITLRMAAAVDPSASHDPAAQAVHEAYAQPETTPSCVARGDDAMPAILCRVRITAGAHTDKTGTVIAAKRGKKLRVLIEHGNRPDTEDDVYASDVTLLDGSAPLPVYVPKAKAAT